MASSMLGTKKMMTSSNLIKSVLRPLLRPAAAVRSYSSGNESDEDGLFVTASSNQSPVMFSPRDLSVSGPTTRLPWYTRETADALHVRFDLPGMGKEDVKVIVQKNSVVIKAEAKEGFNEDDEHAGSGNFQGMIDLGSLFKINEVKAEMKNGVLKLVVPKMKEETRAD